MTEFLYLKDCYMKEFEARVTKAEGKLLVLDKTIFYPASGGQLNDIGVITTNRGKEFSVVNVLKKGDEVIHELDKECKDHLKQLKATDGRTNILVLGIDKRKDIPYSYRGANGKTFYNGFLADTILFASINLTPKKEKRMKGLREELKV